MNSAPPWPKPGGALFVFTHLRNRLCPGILSNVDLVHPTPRSKPLVLQPGASCSPPPSGHGGDFALCLALTHPDGCGAQTKSQQGHALATRGWHTNSPTRHHTATHEGQQAGE